MHVRNLPLLGLMTLGYAAAFAGEVNLWPVVVEQRPDRGATDAVTRTGAGPLLFSQSLPAGRPDGAVRARGFRPFYLETVDGAGETSEAHLLYPFFSYRRLVDGHRWSVFSLVNRHTHGRDGDTPPTHVGLDLWPFYFSRQTPYPESSYRAVLPLYGSVPNRFGQDRLTWVAFPFYARWERNGVTTTTAPWPLVKVLRGEGNRGFELWPLFGHRGKPGVYREQFYLWPLLFQRETGLDAAAPSVTRGFLPFYTDTRTPEYQSRTYLWPFFGSLQRTSPYRYHQVNYLWPVWVQGRGDDRHLNRWGPFYTRSQVKGVDKTWIAWPLWRRQGWTDGPLRHTQRRLLYFVYHDTEQRSATNPALPAARKLHLWPLLSLWDNGAGRRQVQALSPLEVFFPGNEPVRLTYSPLFALYRYDRGNPEEHRHSLLWNLVTYRSSPSGRTFHLGPLLSAERHDQARRLALGNGLISLRRDAAAGERWRLRFFDFKSRPSRRTTSPAP